MKGVDAPSESLLFSMAIIAFGALLWLFLT
jgi:hypothetical protein